MSSDILASEMSRLVIDDIPSPTRSFEQLTSPPDTPTRPKRNPLRAQSHASLKDARQDETRMLGIEMSKLQDRMYEIQEIRHSSSSPTERLNALLSSLAEQIASLSPRIRATPDEDLQREWTKLLQKQKLLGEEMKEDGWLIRFRTTADQAEAMMDHLNKSSSDVCTCLDNFSDLADLAKLDKTHESMKSTYVPSVNKILKMMDRSLNERSTKNGEALRRYGDMETRWSALQRSLAQLDARVRIASQQSDEGEVEILDEMRASQSTEDFLPRSKQQSQSPSSQVSHIPSPSRRLSVSSNDKPRWNISTRVDTSPKRSFGYTGQPPSPTGSNFSGMTSVSRNIPQSRIPIRVTPRRSQAMDQTNPLSTPAHPSMYRAPHTTQTQRTFSRTSAHPLESASAPRPRPKGPPSSFRPTSPSPFLTTSRPSSRMSMTGSVAGHRAGVASSARGPVQELKPFHPSKYDHLDQAVASIIAEEKFDLFVARVDPPLGRGQRRAEGEEWKGTYVFGAGEKQCSVKLLTLAGAKLGQSTAGSRTKCLVRVQGMWVGLAEVLRDRKAQQGDVF